MWVSESVPQSASPHHIYDGPRFSLCVCMCNHGLNLRFCLRRLHACVYVCTHTPLLLLQSALCLAALCAPFIADTAEPSGPDSSRPRPHAFQPLTSMLLFGVTHPAPPSLSISEEMVKRRLKCLLSLERTSGRRWGKEIWKIWAGPGLPCRAPGYLPSLPAWLSLTPAPSGFPALHRCPAAAASAGVPGTPQPGHCAPPGPGPHPVLTCCSWEHEEPPRPAH